MRTDRAALLGGPDDARHVRQAGGLRLERQVLELGRPAVEALEHHSAAAALPAHHPLDELLALDGARADLRAQKLLQRAAEERAGLGVRGDVVPVVVPDDEA